MPKLCVVGHVGDDGCSLQADDVFLLHLFTGEVVDGALVDQLGSAFNLPYSLSVCRWVL
jgi:hypothetical protein